MYGVLRMSDDDDSGEPLLDVAVGVKSIAQQAKNAYTA